MIRRRSPKRRLSLKKTPRVRPAARKKAINHRGNGAALGGLFDIARRLTMAKDLDALLDEIGRTAERLTGAEASSILLLSEDGRSLGFKTASGEKGSVVKLMSIPVDQGIAGWVARHWKPQIVNDASKDARFFKASDRASGFVTRSVLAVPMLMGEKLVGVCEVLNKKAGAFSARDAELLQDMANFAAVAVANARLADSQRNFFTNTLFILTNAIEAHHPAYAGHPARVAEIAVDLGRRLGLEGQALEDLRLAGFLHDIGMIAMSHKALSGSASALAGEKSVERLHPILGWDLVKDVIMLRGVAPLIRHHHEHWDGTGHPDGLAGDVIPLGARILFLLETVEEIRFSGLEDPELTVLQLQAVKNGSGSKFDPRVVDAYLDLRGADLAAR
jgi:HD-GYP domain-containing protein (c-di-GMP phosphodiesterase class II)